MNKLLFKLPVLWRLVAKKEHWPMFQELCKKAALELDLYVWRFSAKKIAWANRYGVIITQESLDKFSSGDIQFILAHEIAHHALGHVGKKFFKGQEDIANNYAKALINDNVNVN